MKTKKIITVLLILTLLAFFSGCGDDRSSSRSSGSQSPTVNEVLEEGMAEVDSSDSEERQSGVNENAPLPEETDKSEPLSSTEGIDIDLTQLSSTMVYSEVFNMMSDPEAYVGKVIKMSGMFAVYQDEAAGKNYYGCIIQDATACCSQGIEFEPVNATVYPDEFPEEMDIVTVTGSFDIYTEDGVKYCTLRDAIMEA